MPICRGGEREREGRISLRNASFPRLFRATVSNNQIDILLYKINRETAALAGFEGRSSLSRHCTRSTVKRRRKKDWDETLFIIIRIDAAFRGWNKISWGEDKVKQFLISQ